MKTVYSSYLISSSNLSRKLLFADLEYKETTQRRASVSSKVSQARNFPSTNLQRAQSSLCMVFFCLIFQQTQLSLDPDRLEFPSSPYSTGRLSQPKRRTSAMNTHTHAALLFIYRTNSHIWTHQTNTHNTFRRARGEHTAFTQSHVHMLKHTQARQFVYDCVAQSGFIAPRWQRRAAE